VSQYRLLALSFALGGFQVDGSGNIAATIHGEVDAEVNGSGDVNLYGDVDLVRSDEDGSGDIVVH
jgi:acyl CoA:acetate/3-ketoacid CoA transferase beta subunit